MKCPNCGGEVSVNDVKCPYCQTPNQEGILFQNEVHKRKRFNEYLRRKVIEQMRMPLIQRCMNLGILFLILLLVFQMIMSLGIYLFAEEAVFTGIFKPDDYEEQMAALYEEGSYGELNAFMDRCRLENTDYPVYTQMCILDYDYQRFLEHVMCCMQDMEQNRIPDDYHLEYAFRQAAELLDPYIPAYPDIYPENQEALEAYQKEALICLTGMFRLSQEEVLTLAPSEEDPYQSDYETIDRLCEMAEENLKKEGYTDETED